ncbi:hypothetical protein AK812_SmicGene24023 [Symbiodinium microadriaticum]|uniref:Uncharacterized protein n=1 Tax=Symbiodinium microadriaticum TaxID=2951 RepID=A0A1Q9DFP3_SYMMI|nr:hypothetical protein AK812_SmicGene24023 [Symbiodinium microadriaticum]
MPSHDNYHGDLERLFIRGTKKLDATVAGNNELYLLASLLCAISDVGGRRAEGMLSTTAAWMLQTMRKV